MICMLGLLERMHQFRAAETRRGVTAGWQRLAGGASMGKRCSCLMYCNAVLSYHYATERAMAEKLIITSALTGAITIPTQSPHLPFTPEHLIADAIACRKAGASAVHVTPEIRKTAGRRRCGKF